MPKTKYKYHISCQTTAQRQAEEKLSTFFDNSYLEELNSNNFKFDPQDFAEIEQNAEALRNDLCRGDFNKFSINGKNVKKNFTKKVYKSYSTKDTVKDVLIKQLKCTSDQANVLISYSYQQLAGPIIEALPQSIFDAEKTYKTRIEFSISLSPEDRNKVTTNLFAEKGEVYLRIKYPDFRVISNDVPIKEYGIIPGESEVLYEFRNNAFHLIEMKTNNKIIRDLLLGAKPGDLGFFTQKKYKDDFILSDSPKLHSNKKSQPLYYFLKKLDDALVVMHGGSEENILKLEHLINLVSQRKIDLAQYILNRNSSESDLIDSQLTKTLRMLNEKKLAYHIEVYKNDKARQLNQFILDGEEFFRNINKLRRQCEALINSDEHVANISEVVQSYTDQMSLLEHGLEKIEEYIRQIKSEKYESSISEVREISNEYLEDLNLLKKSLIFEANKYKEHTLLLQKTVESISNPLPYFIARSQQYISTLRATQTTMNSNQGALAAVSIVKKINETKAWLAVIETKKHDEILDDRKAMLPEYQSQLENLILEYEKSKNEIYKTCQETVCAQTIAGLESYRVSRNKKYSKRDWVGSLFSSCLGCFFEAEKTRRDNYINILIKMVTEFKQATAENEITNMTARISKMITVGLNAFSPRASEGKAGYEDTLHFQLSCLEAKLVDLKAIRHESFISPTENKPKMAITPRRA